MAQTFEWPNLLDVSAGHLYLSTSNLGYVQPTICHDDVVGDFYRMTPEKDITGWGAYVNIGSIAAAGNVPEGTRMAISLFTRVHGEPFHGWPLIRLGSGTDDLIKDFAYSHEDVGGGWSMCTTTGTRNDVAYKGQVFYLGISPFPKAGATIDVAQPMVCVADEPHAWAPAEGEVWP